MGKGELCRACVKLNIVLYLGGVMIHISKHLICSDCETFYDDKFSTVRDTRKRAKKDGWILKKVQSGKFWDLCPRCKDND